ncbi:hypothetical protein LXL04_034280 [Taraxacum kok-saghyz]
MGELEARKLKFRNTEAEALLMGIPQVTQSGDDRLPVQKSFRHRRRWHNEGGTFDFYVSFVKQKSDQIIIFRDGACKFLDEKWCPKFLVIITQKNHHTKFFLPGSLLIMYNQGTTRPTQYLVLYDEIGFSAADLQELVHSLSYCKFQICSKITLLVPVPC